MAEDKPISNRKRLDLGLQGGGAHGAFTWGVLDRLLEDGRIDIEGVCGTSAGAMNAAVLTHGIARGGREGGRQALAEFWERISEAARTSPMQPSPIDRWFSIGNMDFSPTWLWYENISRTLSPYQLNPFNYNPLRDIIEDMVDFEACAHAHDIKLFLCATNVRNGKIKVFKGDELSADAVLASACLPFVFQAVHIKGEAYWDGGYMGNPPIYPLIYNTECEDVLIIQINPINIPEVPVTAQQIFDRINTLSFNSSLMREMRTIHFVTRLIEEGRLERTRYKNLKIHTIDAEAEMAALGVSSKLNASREFLGWLFGLGRERASLWLDAHFDDIGVRSSTDIEEKFL